MSNVFGSWKTIKIRKPEFVPEYIVKPWPQTLGPKPLAPNLLVPNPKPRGLGLTLNCSRLFAIKGSLQKTKKTRPGVGKVKPKGWFKYSLQTD